MSVLRWLGVRFLRSFSFGLAGVSLALLGATSVALGGVSYVLTDSSIPLGVPGGVGKAINNNGQVLGWVALPERSGASIHAFLRGGVTYQDLGTLPGYRDANPDAPGYSITNAFGINDCGQIIAEANIPSKFPIDDAVLLTPISTPTAIALPPAAWAALSALPLLIFGKRIRRAIR